MKALKRSLEPEVKNLPSRRYKGTIETTEDTVSISLITRDLQSLRAITNSYIRYISVGYYMSTMLNPEIY
ncbi:MAG: KEOPS complex subunit Pcc1 [Candidatus Bathyarchaeia archaeon]